MSSVEATNETIPSKLTPNDINHLYSSLQQLGEQVKANNGSNVSLNSEAKFVPLPPSLPISPTSSTPISSDTECSCLHVLGDNLTLCSLCQSPIPIVEQLVTEKANYEREILDLQEQLQVEQQKIKNQVRSIDRINNELEKVMNELDDKTTVFQALQNEMELLNDKYVDEIERVAEIQHSKDMVENELEDLSRRLFEEANGMVASEKREKYNLEVQQRHLENQLTETRERLAAEQMQLKELKKRMEEMMNSSLPDALPKTPDHIKDVTALLAERMLVHDNTVNIDHLMLDEFEEFVRAGTSISLKKIHTNSFMKNCQEEDVESCLRFGPQSRLSARKLNEAIVMNTCFIEEAPPGFAEEQAKRSVAEMPLKISAAKSLMWERFSSNNQTTVFNGCQACGRNDGTALPYRFRISYFDDWACIDRFCRDRLVAVCEFYVLIRNIRQGLYNNRNIPELYHEAMRLRLQMFYARMGALPWSLRTAEPTEDLKLTSSESSPLPKSALLETESDKPRGGSLDNIHMTSMSNTILGNESTKELKDKSALPSKEHENLNVKETETKPTQANKETCLGSGEDQ